MQLNIGRVFKQGDFTTILIETEWATVGSEVSHLLPCTSVSLN